MSKNIVLVKLGGSLITDKRQRNVARHEVIARLASEIAEAWPRMDTSLILGHGSGSFGHFAAAESGLGHGSLYSPDQTLETRGAIGIGATQSQASVLHGMIIEALLQAGVAPFSLAPSSFLLARDGRPVRGQLQVLWRSLTLRRLLPVVYGDVVLDETWGATVCSTEAVLAYLVRRLRRRGWRVTRLLWCGETDGIYDRQGTTITQVTRNNKRQVLSELDDPAGVDVTGGMRLRLETTLALARLGIESWLLNGKTPGVLQAALLGESLPDSTVGTRVLAQDL